MKETTRNLRKKILIVLFFVVFFAFTLMTVFSLVSFSPVYKTEQKCESVEVAGMKKGESVKLSEINAEFAEFEKKYKDGKYYSRRQTTGKSFYDGTKTEDDECGLFVDERGYVHALETGIYYINYVVDMKPVRIFKGSHSGASKMYNSDSYTFSSCVAVYEATETDYTPWKDPRQRWEHDGSYILAADIDLTDPEYEYDANTIFETVFDGIVVNPYGYTITLPEEAGSTAFIKDNYGILDGLKFRVKKASSTNFSAFSENNCGLIRNCSLEGSAELYSDYDDGYSAEEISIFNGYGYFFDNTVQMSLFTDGKIYPCGQITPDRVKGNEFYLDAYYSRANRIKCSRRNVEWELTRDEKVKENNTLSELDGSYPDYGNMHEVVIELPWYSDTLKFDLPDNGRVEIYDNLPAYVSPYYMILGNIEGTVVKYWLVNGKEYETLDELRVTEALTLEPCTKYENTFFSDTGERVDKVYNAEETLTLPTNGIFRANIFDSFYFDPEKAEGFDPFNVYPTKIVIPKDMLPQSETVFSSTSKKFLREFIRGGGQFVIENGNPELLMTDEKSLCSANGRKLLCYFDAEGQTEFKPHSLIRSVGGRAFTEGNELKNFDLTLLEVFRSDSFDGCTAAERISFGKTVEVTDKEEKDPKDIYDLLSGMPKLKKVTVSEENPDYRIENEAVISKTSTASGNAGTLIYYPAGLMGVLSVPDGVTELREDGIGADGVEVLILPDGVSLLNTQSLKSCEKLRKIIFGSPENLILRTGSSGVLPALEEIVFGEIKRLSCSLDAFENSKLGIVTLPDSLETIFNHSNYAEGYAVSEDNRNFSVRDGVLYNKSGDTLVSYPARRQGDSFIVPDGVKEIGKYSFFGAQLLSVAFPDGVREVGQNAFYDNQTIEEISFGKCPEGLTIGFSAFFNNAALHIFEIGETGGNGVIVEDGAFAHCSALTQFSDSDVSQIYDRAFLESGLTDFHFSEKVTLIATGAFEDGRMQNIYFSESCTAKIGDYAFSNTPLVNVALGGVTAIGDYAFYNCVSLKGIDLSGVESLGEHAFDTTDIRQVNNDKLVSVPDSAFDRCASLTVAELPNVQSVGTGAFRETALKNIAMNNVTKIDSFAFFGCRTLVNVSFSNCETVGESAFENCLQLATFEGSLRVVGQAAFRNCAALREIEIRSIGDVGIESEAFNGCTGLKKVVIIGTLVEVKEYAFKDCVLLQITEIEAVRGKVSLSAFSGTGTVKVYLNVSSGFDWEGKIPEGITLYVPEAMVDEILNEWLVNAKQVVAYDFTAGKEV